MFFKEFMLLSFISNSQRFRVKNVKEPLFLLILKEGRTVDGIIKAKFVTKNLEMIKTIKYHKLIRHIHGWIELPQ